VRAAPLTLADDVSFTNLSGMDGATDQGTAEGLVELRSLDWESEEETDWIGDVDVVLGADITYDENLISSLVPRLQSLLQGGAIALIAANIRHASMPNHW